MSNSLGTASLLLTANNAPLTATLGRTEREVRSWASRLGGSLRSSLAAAGKAALVGLGAGLASLAVVSPFERLQDLAKQGDIAQSLGITAEAFTSIAGLANSAGSDTRDFLEALVTLSGKAMDAVAGKGEESVRLFQDLGLNARAFAALNPEQQFYQLFEALGKIENPAQRVNLLLKAVGEDSGKNLVSILGKSTQELQDLGAQFRVSTSEMAAAQVAAQQLTVAKAQLNKALDQVAIALAPVVAVLADGLPAAIEFCRGVMVAFGPPVVGTMQAVVQGVAAVLDVWSALRSSVTVVVGAVVKSFGHLVEGLAVLIDGLHELSMLLDLDLGFGGAAADVGRFAEELKGIGRMVIDGGVQDLQKFGENQRAALNWFDGLMKEREQRVARQAERLKPGNLLPAGGGLKIEVELIKPAMQGTQDATRIIQNWEFGQRLKDDIARQQLMKQQEQIRLLEAIKTAVQQPGIALGVI